MGDRAALTRLEMFDAPYEMRGSLATREGEILNIFELLLSLEYMLAASTS